MIIMANLKSLNRIFTSLIRRRYSYAAQMNGPFHATGLAAARDRPTRGDLPRCQVQSTLAWWRGQILNDPVALKPALELRQCNPLGSFRSPIYEDLKLRPNDAVILYHSRGDLLSRRRTQQPLIGITTSPAIPFHLSVLIYARSMRNDSDALVVGRQNVKAIANSILILDIHGPIEAIFAFYLAASADSVDNPSSSELASELERVLSRRPEMIIPWFRSLQFKPIVEPLPVNHQLRGLIRPRKTD